MALKKFLISIASALLVVFGAMNPIFASGSVSGDIKVVSGDVTVSESSNSYSAADKSVIGSVDVTVNQAGSVTFNVPGAKGKTVTVVQYQDGKWVAVGTVTVGEDGNVIVNLEKSGTVAFITDKASSTSTAKSTVNTAVQSVSPYAFIGLAAVAGCAMLVALKRRAER